MLAAVALVTALFSGAFVVAHWAPDLDPAPLEARYAPPPSQFVEIAGLRTHLRDTGPRTDPMPLVLLHGFGSSLHTWDGWAAALEPSRRVVRIDLPGFGLTGAPLDTAPGLDADVAHVVALLDALGLPRVAIGGNSMGGAVAIALAARSPQRVGALVLVASAGFAPPERELPIGMRIAGLPGVRTLAQSVLPLDWVAASLRAARGDPAGLDEATVERYHALLRRAGNREAFVRRFASLQRESVAEALSSLDVPTLVLWGGRDRLIPPAVGERFAREIRGARLVVHDDLGHLPQEEAPQRTAADVARFLEALAR